MAVRVFPVELTAKPKYTDTFGAPRSGGRTHKGADIFAPEGTPVYAVDAGTLTHSEGKLGGHEAGLKTADWTRYVYSHLSAYEGAPREVKAGELIGYVGKTGNAADTPPHLHFEIHPLNGDAINPTPALDEAKKQAAPFPPAPPSPSPSPSPSPATSSSSSALPAFAAAGATEGLVLLLLLWALSKGMKGRA